MIQVLCGMETSGEMREAFRALGANAVSCDLLPAADGSPHHIQRDIFEVVLSHEWDIAIFHPTCTFLTGAAEWAERWSNQTDSGQNNLSPGEDRWSARSKTYPGIAKATAHHLMSIYLERFAL